MHSGEGIIKELLSDHESLTIHLPGNINYLAADLQDTGTSDFVTNLLETHETMA